MKWNRWMAGHYDSRDDTGMVVARIDRDYGLYRVTVHRPFRHDSYTTLVNRVKDAKAIAEAEYARITKTDA